MSKLYERKKNYYKRNPEKLREHRKKYYAATRETARHEGERWSEVEDNILINICVEDREMSEILGRSMQAIQSRRHILRKRGLMK